LRTGAEVTAGTDTAKAVVPSTLKTELDKKVDKVAGKGLSTNDYDKHGKRPRSAKSNLKLWPSLPAQMS